MFASVTVKVIQKFTGWDQSSLRGQLILLFLTSRDVCPLFQSQGGSPYLLQHLGVTDFSDLARKAANFLTHLLLWALVRLEPIRFIVRLIVTLTDWAVGIRLKFIRNFKYIDNNLHKTVWTRHSLPNCKRSELIFRFSKKGLTKLLNKIKKRESVQNLCLSSQTKPYGLIYSISQMYLLLEIKEKVDGPIIYKDTVYYAIRHTNQWRSHLQWARKCSQNTGGFCS